MPAQPASHAVSASTPIKTILVSAFTRSFLSAAFELGLALLVERADAFLAVFGSNEAIVGRDLELHGRSEVHAEPQASASSAEKGRAARISSFARRSPTARASVCVPPPPGMMPSDTSVSANLADFEA